MIMFRTCRTGKPVKIEERMDGVMYREIGGKYLLDRNKVDVLPWSSQKALT